MEKLSEAIEELNQIAEEHGLNLSHVKDFKEAQRIRNNLKSK